MWVVISSTVSLIFTIKNKSNLPSHYFYKPKLD